MAQEKQAKQEKTEKPAKPAKQDFLTYKGKPLVRNGDTIYYGRTCRNDYVIMLRITSKRILKVTT